MPHFTAARQRAHFTRGRVVVEGVVVVNPTDVLELALLDLIRSKDADAERVLASIEAAMTELGSGMSAQAAAQLAIILNSLSAAKSGFESVSA
jgi:hypothetical protein